MPSAPDSAQFIIAIQKEVHSLITETRTLIPITRGAEGYLENTTLKRIWKIRTTLKCKRKKKPNGEPDKHKARAAARGDTLRRSMIKANAPLPVSYSPTIMPLTFASSYNWQSYRNSTWPPWTSNRHISMPHYHRTQTGSSQHSSTTSLSHAV